MYIVFGYSTIQLPLNSCMSLHSRSFIMRRGIIPQVQRIADDFAVPGVMPKIQALRCVDVSWQSAHVGSTCANATVAAECWAYCEQGFQGSPRRYECVTNGTENPQPLGDESRLESSWT